MKEVKILKVRELPDSPQLVSRDVVRVDAPVSVEACVRMFCRASYIDIQ